MALRALIRIAVIMVAASSLKRSLVFVADDDRGEVQEQQQRQQHEDRSCGDVLEVRAE